MATAILIISQNKAFFFILYGNGLELHPNVMATSRRLYYFPGLISLIGILIYFICQKDEIKIKQYGELSIVFPSDKIGSSNYYLTHFNSHTLEKEIRKKKQIKLTIDSSKVDNAKKMEFVRYEARRLKYTNDTNSVICVTLTNDVTYNDVVRLVDLCYEDKHKRFALIHNLFIISGEYPPQKQVTPSGKYFTCGIVTIFKQKKVSLLETYMIKISPYVTRTNILLVGAWLLLVICFLFYRK